MIEIREKKIEPLYHRITKGVLITISSMAMLIYLIYAVNFVVSGPMETLMDDVTTEFIIQFILLGISLIFLILAWFFHIQCGIVSSLFTIAYVIYNSNLQDVFTFDFLEGLLLFCAVSFVILGLIRNYRLKNEFDIFADPVIEDYDGPDIDRFRL